MDESQIDAEAVKTAEALAAVESPSTEKEQPKVETEPSEKSVKTPEETKGEAPEQVDEEKPDAKAFQAMRQKIKELENEKSKVAAPTEPLVPRIESQPTVVGPQITQTQFFNPETGEFDMLGYQNAVEQRAIASANAVTERRLDEERQTNEAYAKYPELNPQDKSFNEKLYNATSALLLQSMVKGNKLTVKEAAESLLGLSDKALKQAAETGAEQLQQELALKEAASLEATANSSRGDSGDTDLEALSDTTRKGGTEGANALAERLKRSGF